MKKVITFFILLTIFVLPISVYAEVEINYNNTVIKGNDSVKVGDTVKLDFDIGFSGLKKNAYDTKGVALIIYELHFDPSILTVTDISTPGFVSAVYYENNQYYVLSAISEEQVNNKCIDKQLHCGDYEATISFFVKDTKENSAFVEMGYADIYLLDVKEDPEYEYNDDDYTIQNHHIHRVKNFSIEQTQEKVKEPESIISNSKPKVDAPVVENSKKSNDSNEKSKSNNNYLKSLVIEGYDISFNKDTNEYEIDILKDVNSLNITAELADSKASFEIIGNNDLKENDNQVLIKVKAEDGSENTYTIKVNVSSDSNDSVVITTGTKKKNDKGFKFDKSKKKLLVKAGIVVGIVLVIVVIYNIVTNNKIDKKLDF